MEAKGRDGTVTFDGQWLTITRSGWSSIIRGGRGEIRLHIGQITGIELREQRIASARFTVIASGTQQSRFGDQAHDQNPLSVLIPFNGMGQFRVLRDAVMAAISQQSAPQDTVQGGLDVAGQLGRLAQLHAQGALSDEEFAAAKARLIG